MVLRRVVKGVGPCFTLHLDNSRLVKVRRYAKRAARSALAVRAVAYAMHGRQGVDRDRCLPAGAGCRHLQWFPVSDTGLCAGKQQTIGLALGLTEFVQQAVIAIYLLGSLGEFALREAWNDFLPKPAGAVIGVDVENLPGAGKALKQYFSGF